MEVGIISMRYAKALMAFAQEKGLEDRLYQEFSSLATQLRSQKKLVELLDNPLVPSDEKLKLVCLAADGNETPDEAFVRFIKMVLSKKREGYLLFMSLMYMDLYRKKRHIAVGKLTTAVPVSSEMKERIIHSSGSILHANMELETVVEPAIEGGFIFDINDYRLDASVATQLKRVKKQFIEKNRRIV